MSEYWKSTPKYWCKHCSAYVKDTPFERKQHESTGKHQGNLKRFLRGIQNDHEKGERDKERAKAEVERLNKVVGGQASPAEQSGSKASNIRKSATGSLTAVDQKRQWAQLAEMGISVPENFRAEMAMPGQWQTASNTQNDVVKPEDTLSIGVRKRKVEGEEEEEEEQIGAAKQRRGWGSTTRRYPGQEESDLDALLNQTVTKIKADPADTKLEPEAAATVKREPSPPSDQTDVKSIHNSGETEERVQPPENDKVDNQVDIKREGGGLEGPAALTNLQQDVAAPVFKKRKFKAKVERDVE